MKKEIMHCTLGFGPYKDPRYAVSVIVEHGGSGSSIAAPITKKLFKQEVLNVYI